MFTNQLKTAFFLALLTGLMLVVGALFGGQGGLLIALIIAILLNFGMFFFSDKIVLAIYRAKPASESDYKDLYRMVQDVATRQEIPMPKVFIIPTEHSNAFATGRSPKHASIAFTQGIINLLSADELKGVAAHELSHVKNRDTLIATLAATLAGVISYVAMMARWGAIFGGFGGNSKDGGMNIVELLVLGILTPLIATIIQLAISRSREFLADETAARTLHNALPLASALEKLGSDIKQKPLKEMGTTEATAALFIANPFKGTGWLKIFSTHPPIDVRVKRLREMQF